MARLLADEDFDRNVVEILRDQFKHDVLTVQEAGLGNQCTSDLGVLAQAVSDRRAIVTFNRKDFVKVHTHHRPHHGIIICTRDPDAAALAQRIDAAITDAGDMRDQLLRVVRGNQPPKEP
jgi:hypothetical protein